MNVSESACLESAPERVPQVPPVRLKLIRYSEIFFAAILFLKACSCSFDRSKVFIAVFLLNLYSIILDLPPL
jgi:hypothetical protein